MSGVGHGNIDPTLRALGKKGRYQLLQLICIYLGAFGASFQLLNNIFIGRISKSHRCAAPGNDSVVSPNLEDVDWNSSYVTYGKCEIVVSKDNSSDDSSEYPCLFGYEYEFRRELSFRTEFDLVCDRKLLGSLVQACVIMGQGFGAVLSSYFSDRFGRKKVMVISQLALLVLGLAASFSPSYVVLVVLKFLIGAFQQGVLTTNITMAIELMPAEIRALFNLVGSLVWSAISSTMPLFAFLLRDHSWRTLQLVLSVFSVLSLFQWWYLDESLRWLVANGRKEEAVKVLKRAARLNRKDLAHILRIMEFSHHKEEERTTLTTDDRTSSACPMKIPEKTCQQTEEQVVHEAEKDLEGRQTRRLTVLDIFRHKHMLLTAVIVWYAWFTCASSFFGLYMMSTTLHGNRFVNFFVTSLMDVPSGVAFYLLVDRVGRKMATSPMYLLGGVGLVASGIFRMFTDSPMLLDMSVAASMIGMVGATGMFGAVFFITPELFPTNLRNQALGISSFAGRIGGMLAPFMTDLADIAVWAPGVLLGSLCFGVVIAIQFLPETMGRELPNTIEDTKRWRRWKRHSSAVKLKQKERARAQET